MNDGWYQGVHVLGSRVINVTALMYPMAGVVEVSKTHISLLAGLPLHTIKYILVPE